MQSNYDYEYYYEYMPSAVLENGRVLHVAGMSRPVAVHPVSYEQHTIVSEFRGWSQGNKFQFENGQVWVQTEAEYDYNYDYRPAAYLVDGCLLYVDGCDSPVEVRRQR